jgi:hypothetical protein
MFADLRSFQGAEFHLENFDGDGIQQPQGQVKPKPASRKSHLELFHSYFRLRLGMNPRLMP